MKINVRGIVCGVLVLGIGLTAVLGLLAPLVTVGNRFTGGSETGFDIFSGESPVFFTRVQDADDEVAAMIGLFGTLSIVQCAVGAAVIVLGVFCILFPAVRRIGVWCSVLAMGFTVAYLVFGIIYTETVNCVRWKPSSAAARAPKGTAATDVLQAAPAAAPVFADGAFPHAAAGVTNAAPAAAPVFADGAFTHAAAGTLCEGERVELLRVLADLHKQGALTDEEFAAEKARILGM